MSKQATAVLIAILSLPVMATAKEQILCEIAGKPNVVIILGAKRQLDGTASPRAGVAKSLGGWTYPFEPAGVQ
jgi:hypothetical protein